MWQFKKYQFESDFWVSFVAAHVIVPLLYCSIPTMCSVYIFIAQIMSFLYVFLFSYCTSLAFVHRPIFCFSSVCFCWLRYVTRLYINCHIFILNYLVLLWKVVSFAVCFCAYFPALHNYCLLVHGQVTIIFVVSVGLFVCAEFFSAVFDPISIKLGHMLYVWV